MTGRAARAFVDAAQFDGGLDMHPWITLTPPNCAFNVMHISRILFIVISRDSSLGAARLVPRAAC